METDGHDQSFDGLDLEDHAELSQQELSVSAYLTAEETSFGNRAEQNLKRIQFLESEVKRLAEGNRALPAEKLAERLAALRSNQTPIADARYQHKPEIFRRLTGIVNCDKFQEFLAVFAPAVEKSVYMTSKGHQAKPERRKLSSEEQFFIVLVRLRQGATHLLCAEIAGVSEPTLSRIFNMWVNVMAQIIDRLNFFPSHQRGLFNAPNDFVEAGYQRVRIMVDCFEVFCEVPRHVGTQSYAYSHYKHHTTVKFLLGITPSVKLSSISRGFLGSMSDEKAVFQSGLLDLLDEGDQIMADKGFRLPKYRARHARLPGTTIAGIGRSNKPDIQHYTVPHSRRAFHPPDQGIPNSARNCFAKLSPAS